mmetsp:Transcript_27664/g.76093  ORF Transcript_27664/g.76093 Transcript_27664/m.76093 type:complete len:230 (+) Transcript_27664:1050-1739(+)
MASAEMRCRAMTMSGNMTIIRIMSAGFTSQEACGWLGSHEQPASASHASSLCLLQWSWSMIIFTRGWLRCSGPARRRTSCSSSKPHSPLPCAPHWHCGLARHSHGPRPMQRVKPEACSTICFLMSHSGVPALHACFTSSLLVSDAMSCLLLTTHPCWELQLHPHRREGAAGLTADTAVAAPSSGTGAGSAVLSLMPASYLDSTRRSWQRTNQSALDPQKAGLACCPNTQ